MRELIDRESVLDCFHSWVDKRGDMHTPDEMEEYNAIEALPTIEVVRCRDCKRWNTVVEREVAECGLCQSWTLLEVTKSDDFCSRGERRTDAE